jgi:hypothetical protein
MADEVTYTLPHGFTAAEGAVVRARLRITASVSAVDQGLLLRVQDGTYQYDLWVRAAGLNLTGQAEIVCDNTGYVTLELKTRNGWLEVWRDDHFLERAAGVADATAAAVIFSTTGAGNTVTCDLDYLKLARRTWE